jgi:hypothetical protein
MRSFIICSYSLPMLLDDQIKKDEVGGTCNTHGEMKTYESLVGKYEGKIGKRHLGRPIFVDKGIILKLISKKHYESVDWIKLAQNRVQWRTVVNTVMNLRVS